LVFDITGMMRPHLLTLLLLLSYRGVKEATFLYSDPVSYSAGHKTTFSKGAITGVRQVQGFEGNHLRGAEEILLIGSGYDDELIRSVAEAKRSAKKYQLFGLPSLQPHMYQENRLRAARASESLDTMARSRLIYAPANDPFATAEEVSALFRRLEPSHDGRNFYLSPLGTKPQTLGFGLFYLCEVRDQQRPFSLIYPFRAGYESETSSGLARTWIYEIPLGLLKPVK
jgi:hypothetical protein